MSRSLNKIEKKKEELKANLSRIQNDLDNSLVEVKEDVTQSLSPKEIIKKYPLQILGASIAIGFLLGSKGSKSAPKSSSSNNTLVESVGRSIKKRLARKAIDTALDFFEGKLSQREED
ncbi:MAG: hypothetical protein JJ971_09195 [Balneolaceae bacterium]|nr:hypothetical protein [Balneolaceae bacterium]MBO6546581.1 hypothetical protein [Balneolaceae bacterium]MBO6648940.1 hypothetical protein [Balneolaceae bacterium]